ncbi:MULTISPECIES: cobalt-precorrin-5B (C(1))-methyltransferase CbiD [Aphanothece]|uniref:cobalt-precorrin-5B (C(1))-methyltransferase CbiD n=1 Tax=Aphanothece TaxID=1121 RepID=UPI0039849790
MAETGFILPVWFAAAARAAVLGLLGEPWRDSQPLELDPGAEPTLVPVEAVAPLAEGWVLATARSDPGSGVLDLTRGQPLWALVRWGEGPGDWLDIAAGEGVGVVAATGQPCLSSYARDLLMRTLRPLVPPGWRLELRLVIPEGRRLAERTSNAAFGVVEGLALIGTQASVQRSAAPEQLEQALDILRRKASAARFDGALVLVVGENGLDLAPRLGVPADRLVKAGNWLGPLLVAAAAAGVQRLLLFGYQGKLIKLAGGIFHTHHHLADGRSEVLTALAALEGLSGPPLAALHRAPTVEEALAGLQAEDPDLAARLRARIAAAIEERSLAYLSRHGHRSTAVGAVLFDRGRRLSAQGPRGAGLLRALAGPTVLPAAEGLGGGA